MMDDRDGELASFEADREKSAERAEYLRRQQSVRAQPVKHGWTPLRVTGWVAYAVALVLFIGFIVELLNSSDINGPAPLLFPSLVSVCCAAGVWCALGPVLAESRSRGRRVRNFAIALVITAVVAPLLVPVIVSIGSLVADLLSNIV